MKPSSVERHSGAHQQPGSEEAADYTIVSSAYKCTLTRGMLLAILFLKVENITDPWETPLEISLKLDLCLFAYIH